ncbi:hypothetical protein DPMN_100012 [Dreissena polymorpha]|uniref:Uncharacterized protein n=1 Tax=Dreissena polymorpha TaxID=45954 RepID=A0A9D4LF52_DREPO|nr:hypothetical protein DPMN_100012 [Dreissena polymorpha]
MWPFHCKANIFEGCHLQRANTVFFLKFFAEDLVRPADFSETGVDEDLYFQYGGDSGSPALCSIVEYELHDDLKRLIFVVMPIALDPQMFFS